MNELGVQTTDFCEVVVMKWCYIQWFNEWLLMSHERECNPNHILDVLPCTRLEGVLVGPHVPK